MTIQIFTSINLRQDKLIRRIKKLQLKKKKTFIEPISNSIQLSLAVHKLSDAHISFTEFLFWYDKCPMNMYIIVFFVVIFVLEEKKSRNNFLTKNNNLIILYSQLNGWLS